jgi:hypothetical protein
MIMKPTLILMSLLFVLGFAIIVQGGKGSGDWEHANIQWDSFGEWTWESPEFSAEGDDLEGLFRELSIRIPIGEDPDLYMIVKWAGDNGWELVTMDQRVGFIAGWFKRKL